MHLLLITNLFPPQELGGYGRSMADFAWGLEQRGHQLTVLCSDAPYLPQPNSDLNLDAVINRSLQLKGDFKNGVHHLIEAEERRRIDSINQEILRRHLDQIDCDGVLLGNLDLLGPEILLALKNSEIPILHHIGYVAPPFASGEPQDMINYRLIAASDAVRQALLKDKERATQNIPIVYPGARSDLFKQGAARSLPAPLGAELTVPRRLGSSDYPLKICYAGLLMSTKGAHTIAEALLILKKRGLTAELSIAGDNFQKDYSNAIRAYLESNNISENVSWYGQLSRPQLVKYFRLHHVAVFPSIHPEAFGIVAAEAMASGLVLISSGVGGASELFEDGKSGLQFKANNPESLANKLSEVINMAPECMRSLAQNGQNRIQEKFSVYTASAQLEQLFHDYTMSSNKLRNRGHITL